VNPTILIFMTIGNVSHAARGGTSAPTSGQSDNISIPTRFVQVSPV
jgi:hypothetical protein